MNSVLTISHAMLDRIHTATFTVNDGEVTITQEGKHKDMPFLMGADDARALAAWILAAQPVPERTDP